MHWRRNARDRGFIALIFRTVIKALDESPPTGVMKGGVFRLRLPVDARWIWLIVLILVTQSEN